MVAPTAAPSPDECVVCLEPIGSAGGAGLSPPPAACATPGCKGSVCVCPTCSVSLSRCVYCRGAVGGRPPAPPAGRCLSLERACPAIGGARTCLALAASSAILSAATAIVVCLSGRQAS